MTKSEGGAQTEGVHHSTRYPKRTRRAPYLFDYVSDDHILTKVDFYYKVFEAPQTFKDAMSSSELQVWARAMKDEMDRWVCAVKNSAGDTEETRLDNKEKAIVKRV